MEGRKAETLEAVRKARETIPDEMLAEPAPNPKLHGLTGGYLFGRAVALTAKDRVDDAKATVAQLEELSTNTPADYGAGNNTARDMFAIGVLVAKARIADAEGKLDEALSFLRDAVTKEDQTAYDEPSDWFFPVRHILGADLLKTGKISEAEAVYREDLVLHPHNGRALYGLAQTLKEQDKNSEAENVKKQFQQAWSKADITLTASAF